jgi:RNA polymerase sigma-70 factor (ECF subfamily)
MGVMSSSSQSAMPRASTGAARGPQPQRPSLAFLYREHYGGVASSVRFFGVPERDAPDVTHDVFVRVNASLPRYDPKRSLGPWLKTITYRTAQDYLRSAYVRRMRLVPVEDGAEPLDASPGPERGTLLVEMQRVLVEVLQELNDDQRIVYLMCEKDDLPIPEVAEALGVPENTVRSRLARARQIIAAAVDRRRTAEERRQSSLAPMMVPAALADAARKGFEVDDAVKTAVWSRLSRLLGLGIVGALAPLPGAAVAVGAALLVGIGGGAGAALHAALEKPAWTETMIHAEAERSSAGPPSETAAVSASAGASTMATASVAATASPSTSAGEADAGVQDPAALLRAELAILTRAREAMAGEHYDVALRELNRHEKLFPHGKLAEQRKDMKRVVLAELMARDGGAR